MLLAEGIRGLTTPAHIYSTAGTGVVCNTRDVDLSYLAPCNHEEADTRVFVHLADAVRLGHTEALISSGDTDVVVLAVSAMAKLPALKELWVDVGNGRKLRYIAVHEISAALGKNKFEKIRYIEFFIQYHYSI